MIDKARARPAIGACYRCLHSVSKNGTLLACVRRWGRPVEYGVLESNYLLRLLSVEGMKLGRLPFGDLSFMPKVPLFIPRTSALHISFYTFAGGLVRPKDLVRLNRCSDETVRLFLREAEKADLLKITRDPRPLIEANPVMHDMLYAMMKGQSEAVRHWPTGDAAYDPAANLARPQVERMAAAILLFSLISNDLPQQRYIFRSVLRRSLSAFLVLADSHDKSVSERWVREQFFISHESLRQYKAQMQDMGYLTTHMDNGRILLRATPALREVIGAFIDITLAQLDADIPMAQLYRDRFDNYGDPESLVAE